MPLVPVDHRCIEQFGPHQARIAVVALDAIVDLRHRILRAGLPREAAIFSGDDDPTTLHFGAFLLPARIIGCATFHLNEFEGHPAWQLRGMASEADFRHLGIGAALLRYAERCISGELPIPNLAGTPVVQLWCNARTPAIGFYEKQGWRCISEEFDIPTAGPHRRMSKHL